MLSIAKLNKIGFFILVVYYITIYAGADENPNTEATTKHETEASKFMVTPKKENEPKAALEKYIVSVRRRTFNYIFGDDVLCAGGIISPKLIMTSAICLTTPKNKSYDHTELSVVVGSPNRFIYSEDTERLLVQHVIIHPNYVDRNTWNWNIGLLKLYKKIKINNRTAAVVSLPNGDLEKGMTLTLIGWGRYYKHGPTPGRLVSTDIDVAEQEMCDLFNVQLGENEYCAAEMDASEEESCIGYRGGTAIYKNAFVGIVEYSPNCINLLQPVRFLKIYKLLNWITENGCAKCFSFNLFLLYFTSYTFLQ